MSVGLQTKWNMASTLQRDLQNRNVFACIWFVCWMKSGCVAKVEPGSAYNPTFCFAGRCGGVGAPTSLIDCLCSNDKSAAFFYAGKKAWSCSYTDDRESDSYGCNRLTNDDASWYVLLISKCLLRHIVWSIKCWIQWKIPITNWRSRWLFIF